MQKKGGLAPLHLSAASVQHQPSFQWHCTGLIQDYFEGGWLLGCVANLCGVCEYKHAKYAYLGGFGASPHRKK